MPTRHGRLLAVLLLLTALVPGPRLQAQVTPDQAADMLLNAARRAYNDKNYDFAATQFRDFLGRFGGHKAAASARYGLALCLIEGEKKNYPEAIQNLQGLAGDKNLPDHPFVLYYLGLAQRGQGVEALALAAAQPAQANQHRDTARQRFEEANKQFAAAVAAFTERADKAGKSDKLSVEREWAIRARCDQAEMQLRLHRPKEAQATTAVFLDNPELRKSRYHGLGLYQHGFACFLLGDHQKAGRALSMLAPFSSPVFGTHARYLLARVHHSQGERQEALAQYDGVQADYNKHKQEAAELLKQPDRFKTDPEEKDRLEKLAKGPTPDHVRRAGFFLAVMQYEDGKFAEAAAQLAQLRPQLPAGSPLAAEAQLRHGFCQVHLKQFAEAQQTLQPLVDKEPSLTDQALLWIGKAQAGAANAATGPAREQALRTAADTLRRAAEKAGQLAGSDPKAQRRRGEILLEMADTQQEAGQPREAAGVYNQVLNDKLLPERSDEVLHHLAVAWQLARDFNESDKVCERFQKEHAKSVLLPGVLFRHAENAWQRVLEAEKKPDAGERERERKQWTEEAVKRYGAVVEKFPEFRHTNLARYGLGMAHYQAGRLDKAREALERIPVSDRTGELGLVSYQLADILIRQAPAKADDAVAAGKLEEQLKKAVELLEGTANAQPPLPQSADALFKIGHCQQRLAGLLAQPPDQAVAVAAARAAYEQLMQRFGADPLQPAARFERAKCLALAKDVNGAINELRGLAQEPLEKGGVAPLAALHLATLLRGENKGQEAADVLAKCRQQHEAALKGDPKRASLVPLLQYHHAAALREAGKLREAREVFDLVAKQTDRPEAADAALRAGQCLKEEGQKKVAEGKQRLSQPGLPPPEQEKARQQVEQGLNDVRTAVTGLVAQADQLKAKKPEAETRARMLYEAAWGSRLLADEEIEAARLKLRQELWDKHRQEVAQKAPAGQKPPDVPAPEVPLAKVPEQPAEKQAQTCYQTLIADFPESPLNADALFELAELQSLRGRHEPAIKLLKDALDKEPSPELTDKVRVRLGDCLLLKGDFKAAVAQLEPVAKNEKSPMSGPARYRLGECCLKQGDHAGAVKHLAVFRDQGPYQNLPGLSDRALLRLGYALAQAKQWDASRQAYEQLLGRFGTSPWANQARYGIGWAWQNQGQFDNAVNSYTQVVNNVTSKLAARAQMNIGLCRLAQKRYMEASTALLVVPYTYDYPDLSALSLMEAARALSEDKQPRQAAKLLRRILRDHPDSEHAEAARQRLAQLEPRGG
jgi:TolA-binding protein